MSKLNSLLLLTALGACTPSQSDEDLANRSGFAPTNVRYFPSASSQPQTICFHMFIPREEPAVDGFGRRWYSQFLAAAKEPSLYLGAQKSAVSALGVFRLTWLRTFHAPVFIRIFVDPAGKYHIVAKELSGEGGYAPGTRVRTLARQLTAAEARNFILLLKQTNFLDQPSNDCRLGMDGSEWVFEAIDQDGYHLSRRWSPEKGPAHEVGEFLLRLTGWDFGEVY